MDIPSNNEWAAVLRAELDKVWKGYTPNEAVVTPSDDQGDAPVTNMAKVMELRHAARVNSNTNNTEATA